jgi:hypothetical protein
LDGQLVIGHIYFDYGEDKSGLTVEIPGSLKMLVMVVPSPQSCLVTTPTVKHILGAAHVNLAGQQTADDVDPARAVLFWHDVPQPDAWPTQP